MSDHPVDAARPHEPDLANAALHESERNARLVVDSIPGLVALLTVEGQVYFANQRLLDFTGRPLEDLQQWGTNGTVYPSDLPHVVEVFSRSIATGTPYEIVQRLRRSDGHYRWFKNEGSPLRDADGQIVGWCVLLTDIEEQRHAEEALRKSERESRRIVESIPGLIVTLTESGVVAFENSRTRDYLGPELAGTIDWTTNGIVHPEDVPRVIPLFAHGVESRAPFEYEVRLRRFDGAHRWFQQRAHPFTDDVGRVIHWYVLFTDIDDRKRAEDATRASEQQLKLITDTMPALAWSALPDGSADFLSQHFLDFIGQAAEQANGWGWTAAVHPEDLHGLAATWQDIMASGAPGETEARLRRHDGGYRWFLLRTHPLRDETGAIVRWYGVNTDIEDRKRAEAELRRAYDSFSDAQRLSKTGSFITDLVGNNHNWSEETYRIFEFEAQSSVTVERIQTIIHPEDLPSFEAMIARALTGVDVNFAFRILPARSGVKHVRGVAHVIEEIEGRPMFVGALQDVTESMVAEEALNRARSELARVTSMTTLSALTASIAHEVNQPLSGIMTNAATGLRMLDATPPDIAGARETARRTIRDANRASDVISHLRALFSKREFTVEPLDLNDAAREVIALSASDLQRHHITLQTSFALHLPLIPGDRIQLQQVVLNLLRNAAEAMAEIHDRPRRLLISTEREDGGGVRLSVRDSGVGFDPEIMARLFGAFYTTKDGGMGIGLFVSRSIIERHQGRLWAEPNADGPGSTFAFVVPSLAGMLTNEGPTLRTT